jgi:hypothetical protein
MKAALADAPKPEEVEDRKRCEQLTGRIGRQVVGVASVRPATRDGWVFWAGLVDDSVATVMTGARRSWRPSPRRSVDALDGQGSRPGWR